MRNAVVFMLTVCFFWSCKQAEPYKQLTKNIQFKYLQFGEGKTPQIGDYLATSFTICDANGDTLHYVPNYPYTFQLQDLELDSACLNLNEGDSGFFRLPRKLFNQKFKFYQPLQADTGNLTVYFKLHKVLHAKDLKSYQQKELSKRELAEQVALKRYISKLDGYLDTVGDSYRLITKINHEGESILNGSEVSIHYTGSFLNGYVFEDSRKKAVTPTFQYGKEYQMIEGMQMGLSGLKSGESVKIILPSRRAFGKEGSLAGIVPPYTAVIFDVNILKVVNQK
jgi:FKBP-type peptidyl-prolyl cis-trans isomerase